MLQPTHTLPLTPENRHLALRDNIIGIDAARALAQDPACVLRFAEPNTAFFDTVPPVTDITTVVPPHASSRWLLIHARLDAGVVRIRSARPAVSSVRRRNTAETV